MEDPGRPKKRLHVPANKGGKNKWVSRSLNQERENEIQRMTTRFFPLRDYTVKGIGQCKNIEVRERERRRRK